MSAGKLKKKNFKSITLVASSGRGLEVVKALFENGHTMVDLHHARGSFIGGPMKKNGMAIETEQEVVTCVVDASRADEVFRFIHDTAKVDEPGGGIMYMSEAQSGLRSC